MGRTPGANGGRSDEILAGLLLLQTNRMVLYSIMMKGFVTGLIQCLLVFGFLMVVSTILVLPFWEFARRRKLAGRYWVARYLLVLTLYACIPLLVYGYYVLGEMSFLFRNIADPLLRDMVCSLLICIILPVALYFLSRKLVK